MFSARYGSEEEWNRAEATATHDPISTFWKRHNETAASKGVPTIASAPVPKAPAKPLVKIPIATKGT
jgi:hypothetical protein